MDFPFAEMAGHEMVLVMLYLMEFPLTVAGALSVFFALAIGHALADFPLQGEYLASCKNRHHKNSSGGKVSSGVWVVCMLSHCLIHAGMVWAVTGQVVLGVAELVMHFVIDCLKCEGRLNFESDQALHYGCKLVYVGILYQGWLA